MARRVLSSVAIATAAATAFSAAAITTAYAEMVKCYGVAEAGENDCANVAGTHSCAGQSTVDYAYDEWKMADEADCLEMGGTLEGGEGINEKLLEA